ncbi:MAG: streptogramin lyase, partial [Pseudohongiellaceae bacterium]
MKCFNYACLIGSIACLASACSEQAPENTSSDITDTVTINLPQAIEQALPLALPLDMQTDGVVTAFTMLSENAGPTTISIAPDNSIWYTLSSGNAIGRMNPDGSDM